MGPSGLIPLLAWDFPCWVNARSPSRQGYTKGSIQVQQAPRPEARAAIQAGPLGQADKVTSCARGKPCLSPSPQIQPCPCPKPALTWCVRLDNGTKLSPSLNPHPLPGDCVLLDFGFGQWNFGGLDMSKGLKSAYQIRLAPWHHWEEKDMAGPRRTRDRWSQSIQPTPANLLWAGEAGSWKPLRGGAWLRCWPDGLNWVLIQSPSPVYRF